MLQPDLSICIVNWNCRDYLRGCLDSIREARSGLDVETIVVDNASTDGSPDMAATDFRDVILVRNDSNCGFSKANNQAAALSRGRNLLFLNNDTVVARNSLRALVSFLQAHPQVGMVGPKLIGRNGKPQCSYRRKPTLGAMLHRLAMIRCLGLCRKAYQRYRRNDYSAEAERPVEVLLGAAVCLPREVFLAHGGWDEKFPFGVEDFDLSTRVGRTHQVVFFPGAEIVHLGKMSSRRNCGFVYTALECGHARYLRKHIIGPFGLAIYKLLVLANLPPALAFQFLRQTWRRLRNGPEVPGRAHSQFAALWHFGTRGLPRFLRT